MGISLKNKIVFVTGASAGIGAAAALEFAKQGARILMCSRRIEKLKAAEPALRAAGASEVFSFELDVQDRAAVERTIASLPGGWRDIDILVNNAGLSRGLQKIYEDDIDDWEEMIDTNIKGLLYITRAVVPGMVERNSGHIINLGSIAGHIVYPKGAVYCATKAAVNFIGDGLRIDLNGTDIRVTSIDPGMVETEFSLVRFRGNKERAAKSYENITPLTAEDIADAIIWSATRPAHMQIQTMILTCVAQTNPYVITKRESK